MANMRKNIKKNINSTGNSDEGININKTSNFKITAIICIVMILLAYGVSTLIYTLTKQPSTITDIKQYNINSSVVFNMPEDKYYVLFYDKTGVDAIVLNSIIDTYRKSNKGQIYVVDLSKEYNKSIISDTPNLKASTSAELKINGSTLIKIEDGQNKGYYESVFLIEKELNN